MSDFLRKLSKALGLNYTWWQWRWMNFKKRWSARFSADGNVARHLRSSQKTCRRCGAIAGAGDRRCAVCGARPDVVGSPLVVHPGFGAVHAQAAPFGAMQVEPREERRQFGPRGCDLLRLGAPAAALGQLAAEIPDPLAIAVAVAGYRQPRYTTAAHAMGVQRAQRGVLDQHLVQRATLHARSGGAELRKQFLVAGACAENRATGAKFESPVPDAGFDAENGAGIVPDEPGGSPVDCENTSAACAVQRSDDRAGIHHGFAQSIDGSDGPAVVQGRRQRCGRQTFRPSVQQVAREARADTGRQFRCAPEVGVR